MSGRPCARVARDARLHVEVDALEEAGGLDHAAELRLAPHAARAVRAQRRRERLGGGTEALFGLGGDLQLLGELAVLPVALRLELR